MSREVFKAGAELWYHHQRSPKQEMCQILVVTFSELKDLDSQLREEKPLKLARGRATSHPVPNIYQGDQRGIGPISQSKA